MTGQTGAAEDIFAVYPPPYDLVTDMLFVAAWAPLEPLKTVFPAVPFFALGGRALLVMWFSRVSELCYHAPSGERRCLGGSDQVPYNELNVVPLLRRRAIFVPRLYATSKLSVRVAHGYGMPKGLREIDFRLAEGRIDSRVTDGGRESFVRARPLGSGRPAGEFLSRFWPWWSWPARFPGGSEVRAMIQATPRLQLAQVQAGRLALEESWLPEPLSFWPVGLYVPNLRMRLPPPPGCEQARP